MQIHEITKRVARTDEGILDDLKAAVTATKTGFKAGGLAGVAKNLTSRTAYNQAIAQNQRASNNKDLDKLEKQFGSKIARPLSFYTDQLQNPTTPEFKDEASQAQAQRNKLTPEFTDVFINDEPSADQAAGQGPGDVLPDPGQVLMVKIPAPGQNKPSLYYKTVNGKWYAENGQQLPVSSYGKLEDLITQDQYEQVPMPTNLPGGQVTPVGKTRKTQATAKTAPVANAQQTNTKAVKETGDLLERASAARKARRAAQGITQPAGTVAQSAAPVQKKGRANIKADFLGWIANQMGSDYKTVIANSTVKSELTKIFNVMTQNKDPKMNSDLFKRYVLIVQAAILKAKVEQGIENDEGRSPNDDAVERLKGKAGKKTGNPEADQILQGLGMTLNEGQAAITKDIRVKSSKGDYVKRASDQQWYDPNGILISQEKYPDFVKKLDATPAAQNAYSAALAKGTGSDSAFIQAKVDAKAKAEIDAAVKAAVAKALAEHPPPPPPPPQATAADFAYHQAEVTRQNNAALAKSINDLRYSEYFNTGQQDYLKQQVAQLIGTR